MLDKMQPIAKRLWRLRLILVVIAAAGFTGFCLSLFESPILQGWQVMLPSLVALFWATTGLSFGAFFARVPEPPNPESPMLARWASKLKRFAYSIIGILMLALVLSLVVLSYQLIRAWSLA